MRLFSMLIRTDHLQEVRDFWANHFRIPMTSVEVGDTLFTIYPLPEISVTYVPTADQVTSNGLIFRWLLPHIPLERSRLIAAGVECSELKVEFWGEPVETVRYFTFTDPSGATYAIYEDHFGANKQLMTTADGTGTREVQRSGTAAE